MKPLNHIFKKMMSIGIGMLRSKEDTGQISLQVQAIRSNDEFSDWELSEECEQKLLDRTVSLVQKKDDDYIYITGKVARQHIAGRIVLSIKILRACWMVRRSKDSVTWLDEKFIYDVSGAELKMAS